MKKSLPTEKCMQSTMQNRLLIQTLLFIIQIPDLAKKVLLNEFRFKQLFKRIFGTGPYEYLIKKRLEKRKALLESGLSVKETAAHVGYRPSDFTTAFRRYQMILTVDPVTNNVTITPAGVTPNVDQHWGLNYYDPATKSYHLHYSYNTAAPRMIEETITKL
jgi:AraC-like DNA-binding protein